jgi:hypothetical protein
MDDRGLHALKPHMVAPMALLALNPLGRAACSKFKLRHYLVRAQIDVAGP